MKTNSRTHATAKNLGFAPLREILYSLVAVRPPCDSVVKIGLIYVNL